MAETETRTPTWQQSMNGLLYLLAGCFLPVGGLLLAAFILGDDPGAAVGFGALACIAVGLLALILVQLAEIRLTLKSVKREEAGAADQLSR